MSLEDVAQGKRYANRGAWWTAAILCFAGAALVYYLGTVLGFDIFAARSFAAVFESLILAFIEPRRDAITIGFLLVVGVVCLFQGYRMRAFPEQTNDSPF